MNKCTAGFDLPEDGKFCPECGARECDPCRSIVAAPRVKAMAAAAKPDDHVAPPDYEHGRWWCDFCMCSMIPQAVTHRCHECQNEVTWKPHATPKPASSDVDTAFWEGYRFALSEAAAPRPDGLKRTFAALEHLSPLLQHAFAKGRESAIEWPEDEDYKWCLTQAADWLWSPDTAEELREVMGKVVVTGYFQRPQPDEDGHE